MHRLSCFISSKRSYCRLVLRKGDRPVSVCIQEAKQRVRFCFGYSYPEHFQTLVKLRRGNPAITICIEDPEGILYAQLQRVTMHLDSADQGQQKAVAIATRARHTPPPPPRSCGPLLCLDRQQESDRGPCGDEQLGAAFFTAEATLCSDKANPAYQGVRHWDLSRGGRAQAPRKPNGHTNTPAGLSGYTNIERGGECGRWL
jgi:hypothetical protein